VPKALIYFTINMAVLNVKAICLGRIALVFVFWATGAVSASRTSRTFSPYIFI